MTNPSNNPDSRAASRNQRALAMGRDSIWPLLIRFSGPTIISMLVSASYNVVDTIFVGRLGTEAVAALSLAFPIFMVFMAFGTGAGIGAGSLISRNLGAKREKEANRVAANTISLTFILSAVMMLAFIPFIDGILGLLGGTGEVLAMAREYTLILIWPLVIFLFSITAGTIVRAEGNPYLSSIVQVISGVANVILDPIFIFGWGPVPAMGIAGAAYATVISWGLAVGVYVFYLFSKKTAYQFRPSYFIPDFGLIRDIYRVGMASTVQMTAGSIVMSLVNRVAASFGVIPLAVLGTLLRVISFAFMPCVGLAQGAMPLIAYNFGAKQKERVSEVVIKSGSASFAWGFLFFLIAMFFPAAILSIFNTEPEFISVGTVALRMFAISAPVVGIQIIGSSFFQGVGKGLPSLLLASARQVIVLLPTIIFLPRLFGLTGLWVSFPMADTISVIITVVWTGIYFRKLGIPFRLPGRRAETFGAAIAVENEKEG